jgi:hypothetical protein
VAIADWRVSSYSYNGSSCVEAGNWRTSSHSGYAGNCTEVASCGHGVAVRDSVLGTSSPVLSFRAEEWSRFAVRVKRGEAVTDG